MQPVWYEFTLIGAALLVGVAVGYLAAQLLAGRRREHQLAQLVTPLQAALEASHAQAQQLEGERRDIEAALRAQIELLARGQAGLERETRNLVTALRRPEVRGRCAESWNSQASSSIATSPSSSRSAAVRAHPARIWWCTYPMHASW
jgi:hypothetical protein